MTRISWLLLASALGCSAAKPAVVPAPDAAADTVVVSQDASADVAKSLDAAADAVAVDAAGIDTGKADSGAAVDVAAGGDAVVDAVDSAAGAEVTKPLDPCAAPAQFWTKSHGGPGSDVGSAVTSLPGGVAVVGWTDSKGNGGRDGWLTTFDGLGSLTADNTYGGDANDELNAVIATPTGLLAVGSSQTAAKGNRDGWILRTDGSGATVSTLAIGEAADDELYGVAPTTDGYIAAGYREMADGALRLWLVKLSPDGALVWQTLHGTSGFDAAYDVVSLPDGGAAAVGDTSDGKNAHLWLTRFDAGGKLVWQRTFQDAGQDSGWGLLAKLDAAGQLTGFAVAGRRQPQGAAHGSAWLIETDTAGKAQWQQAYGATAGPSVGYGLVRQISLAPGAGYVVPGEATNGAGKSAALLWQVGASGTSTWAFAGSAGTSTRAVAVVDQQAYVAVGQVDVGGKPDLWLARVSVAGKTCP